MNEIIKNKEKQGFKNRGMRRRESGVEGETVVPELTLESFLRTSGIDIFVRGSKER